MLKITIPIALPSQNSYIGRSHWKLVGDKKKFENAVGLAFLIAKANGHVPPQFVPPCSEPRTIKVVTYRHRLLDQDNVSTKALFDVLKKLEMIRDDSPKWLTIDSVIQQHVVKKEQARTEITLW